MQIIKIDPSEKKDKRFIVTLDDGRKFDFGLKTGQTYIDHHDKVKRENYLKRHLANKIENKLINDLIPSPALFSAFLLWGPSTNLEENIKHLNNLMSRKK